MSLAPDLGSVYARPYMVIRTYREHEPSIMTFRGLIDVHSFLFEASTTEVQQHLRDTIMTTSHGIAYMLEAMQQNADTYGLSQVFYYVNGHIQPRYPEGF